MANDVEPTVLQDVLPYGEGGSHETSPPRGDLTPEWEAESDEVGVPAGSVVQEVGLPPGERPEGEDADSTDPGTAETPVLIETVAQEPASEEETGPGPPPEEEA